MRLTLMKSKIHRAVVTEADLHYEGSIAIDPKLCELARFYPNERVDIYNITNGNRFSTYVIYGKPGQICINGAAARLVAPDDQVIIVTYADFEEKEALDHEPTVVLLTHDKEKNEVKSVERSSGRQYKMSL
jgi:aspartate 1-decarboxylase